MNERIQLLLDKKRSELEAERIDRRNRHLIEIGLYELGDSVVWADEWDASPGWKFDKEKGKYYKEATAQKKAISVTDEEYAEICKLFPENQVRTEDVEIDKSAEKTLRTIANVLLIVGIIVSVIIIVVASALKTPLVALGAVIYFLMALATWAILRCFADISITLKEIKKKMNK